MPKRNPKRDEVIQLRKAGMSMREIEKKTGVLRSSIWYMVKGIELTDEQRATLFKKRSENGSRMASNLTPEQRMRGTRRAHERLARKRP